ncbi:MAG: D-hexose-6-phosphate mutarotase [Burkholderiales bacterium]
MKNSPTACVELSLPGGDRARIALFGGHVLSWQTADGVERLYLSPDALFDNASPIRGGVPICFPQFNTRGPLPKHGIARVLPWHAETPTQAGAGESQTNSVRLRLRDSDATRRWWPQAFEAVLTVTLAPGRLTLALDVRNTDSAPWRFTAALHSYLRVADIVQVRLAGLQNQPYWDALTDQEASEGAAEIAFNGPFDRVYRGITESARLEVREPRGTLTLTQSASLTEAVVWNPGAALSATLPDLPDDGYRSMLCIEAAKIDAPVLLAPGQRWQGWQQFRA